MANETMRQTWCESGVGWVANEQIFDAVMAPFTNALLNNAAVGADNRVLDIGCGSGTLLQHATLGLGATAVGIDISHTMVEAARRRAPEATVLLDDAQTVDFRAVAPGPPFDRVVSRFGVMFFDDPVAAFSNIRRATASGAGLTFVCWRDGDNPMFTMGTDVLAAALSARDETAPEPAAVNPQSLGTAERISDVLSAAGWQNVVAEPFDGLCDYSMDGSDGVEERLAIIEASNTGRRARAALAPALGGAGWAELLEEVREELRSNLVDGAVRFPGYTWVVTGIAG